LLQLRRRVLLLGHNIWNVLFAGEGWYCAATGVHRVPRRRIARRKQLSEVVACSVGTVRTADSADPGSAGAQATPTPATCRMIARSRGGWRDRTASMEARVPRTPSPS